MKYRLNVIIVILFVCASTNNSYGQLIPVSGGRTHPVNVLESGDIAFGWGKTGISAFYINAGQEGAYSPVDVMQVTNNGNFCLEVCWSLKIPIYICLEEIRRTLDGLLKDIIVILLQKTVLN